MQAIVLLAGYYRRPLNLLLPHNPHRIMPVTNSGKRSTFRLCQQKEHNIKTCSRSRGSFCASPTQQTAKNISLGNARADDRLSCGSHLVCTMHDNNPESKDKPMPHGQKQQGARAKLCHHTTPRLVPQPPVQHGFVETFLLRPSRRARLRISSASVSP